VHQLSGSKLRLQPWMWRAYGILTFTAYSLLTVGCAIGIVVGVWRGVATVGLVGTALGVYCASELRVLLRWVRAADPSGPPVEPAWNVFICALVFVVLVAAARWVWGP